MVQEPVNGDGGQIVHGHQGQGHSGVELGRMQFRRDRRRTSLVRGIDDAARILTGGLPGWEHADTVDLCRRRYELTRSALDSLKRS